MEPGLAYTSLSIPFSTLATLGFYLIATFYIVFTAILYYHWNAYSTSAKVSSLTLIVYVLTTLPLMSILLYNAFNI